MLTAVVQARSVYLLLLLIILIFKKNIIIGVRSSVRTYFKHARRIHGQLLGEAGKSCSSEHNPTRKRGAPLIYYAEACAIVTTPQSALSFVSRMHGVRVPLVSCTTRQAPGIYTAIKNTPTKTNENTLIKAEKWE